VTSRTQLVTSFFLAFHVVAARGRPGGALGAAGEAQARESWFCSAVEDGCVAQFASFNLVNSCKLSMNCFMLPTRVIRLR